MKNILRILALVLLLPSLGQAQQLSLDELHAAARAHFPEFKQKQISHQAYELELDKLKTLLYPKMTFNAQATWQSDVTSVPLNLPGLEVQKRDQYKAFVDLNQVLWDGGLVKRQLALREAQQATEQQKIEVSLNKVQEQVDLLFFSNLLLKEQSGQLEVLKTTLEGKLKQVQGAIANGVMLQSNAWLLEAELIKLAQQQAELDAQRKTALRMLSEWTGVPETALQNLQAPPAERLPSQVTLKRPELELFRLQDQLTGVAIEAVDAKYMPRVFAFAQLGYGRPGLNFLDTRFRPWALVGAKLTWDIYDWGAGKVDKQNLDLQRQMVGIQREALDRQVSLGMIQIEEDWMKLEQLLKNDGQLIELRSKIKETASVQLDNGVITATEYLDRVNEETSARLNQSLHRVQQQMVLAKFNYLTGNKD